MLYLHGYRGVLAVYTVLDLFLAEIDAAHDTLASQAQARSWGNQGALQGEVATRFFTLSTRLTYISLLARDNDRW